jgi:hypothetical protein
VITIRSEETWSLRFSRLGPAGIGLLVMLLGWSDSQLTDGQIPAGAPPLRGVSRRLIDRMIALGEIEETPAGYLIVHYDRYCLMRARILQRAEYERAKKKRQRSARDPESADLPDSPMVMGAVPTGHPTGHPQGHSLPLPSPSPSPSLSLSHPKPDPCAADPATSSLLTRAREDAPGPATATTTTNVVRLARARRVSRDDSDRSIDLISAEESQTETESNEGEQSESDLDDPELRALYMRRYCLPGESLADCKRRREQEARAERDKRLAKVGLQ